MNGDKKLIYFLVALIIFFAIILLVKIKTTPKYNPKIYEGIYDEYEDIFGENDDSDIKNIQEYYNNIKKDNNTAIATNNQTTIVGLTTSGNTEQGNVIAKMIIPQIDVKCPIIKETTKEYLEVAPTKYCGPEVNEIRKFSYSRS